MTIHCLFHDYSDYECSAETLIAVYLSQSDAETGLLELIARAENLTKVNQAFDQRYRDCHERNVKVRPTGTGKGSKKTLESWQKQYEAELQIIIEEQKTWRQTEFGSDWGDIPDTNIDSYHIDEVEIGVLRR
jgi:hypothetical protein